MNDYIIVRYFTAYYTENKRYLSRMRTQYSPGLSLERPGNETTPLSARNSESKKPDIKKITCHACTTGRARGTVLLGTISLSLRICCKFAHFLISTIAKEYVLSAWRHYLKKTRPRTLRSGRSGLGSGWRTFQVRHIYPLHTLFFN